MFLKTLGVGQLLGCLSWLRACLGSTVRFVVALENAINPWSQLFHISRQKIKLSLQIKS